MKVFQIFRGFCHCDYTSRFGSIEGVRQVYKDPALVFVEAPDYVFEGWGYDEAQTGDARFIKPTPPEGWLYDDKTGTFYLETWYYDEEHKCWIDSTLPNPFEDPFTNSDYAAGYTQALLDIMEA